VIVTLVLALTLALALPAAAQPLTSADPATGVFGGGPFVKLCESFIGSLLPRVCFNTAVGFNALRSNTTGSSNTAVGAQALQTNTTGDDNTALGFTALLSNTEGGFNTAVGAQALQTNTTGFDNTATGDSALFSNTTGAGNTATGVDALFSNTTGSFNTAIGTQALFDNTTGTNNIALGFNAGFNVTTGSSNIHIGNQGTDADNALIRIGTAGSQTATLVAGIRGVTTGVNDALSVLIDSTGQLGTANSSRRVKADIRDIGEQSRVLYQLRPVSFRYRSHPPDGPPEYGLIAEEVAEIYPELVVLDKNGQPSGVRYHVLPAMLLNEIQRQQREIVELRAKVQEIDELRAHVRALIGAKAAATE
jgi:Chaperone of endosialidase